MENYRTRNTQTFCPVLERQDVMGLEIFGPVHFFSDPPPHSLLASNIYLMRWVAMGGGYVVIEYHYL